mmetsp:Transcript_32067/g.75229  ORF Transcript_32067/g.75229 Transcript_32067/m.75229 type:complete len:302 (-) Transcript_32067:34-939(-)
MEVAADEKLLGKEILRTGQKDERPKPGDCVKVHYRCAWEQSGQVVDSTYDRGEAFAFTLGQDEAMQGLEQCVQTMEVGEQAIVTISPELALGQACWAAYTPKPSGQGQDRLCIQVELLAIGGEGSSESAEQKVLAALRAKDAGNVHFKSGSLEAARSSYQEALDLLSWSSSEADAEWVTGAVREERSKLALACCLNLAQCELKLELHLEAATHAEQVVQIEPNNVKGLYRLGQAYMHLGYLDKAQRALHKAASLEPTNRELRAQLEACQKKLQASEQKDRGSFGGMFNKGSLYEDRQAVDA